MESEELVDFCERERLKLARIKEWDHVFTRTNCWTQGACQLLEDSLMAYFGQEARRVNVEGEGPRDFAEDLPETYGHAMVFFEGGYWDASGKHSEEEVKDWMWDE